MYVHLRYREPTPCIHGDGRTLCPDCQAEYDADPTAYEEYGDHRAGIRRTAELRAEHEAARIEAAKRAPADTSDYPL